MSASPGQASPIDGMIWGGRRPLPVMFDGQPIKFRIPYSMPGELVIDVTANPPPTSLQFPDSVFSHQIDKPFEIHRVFMKVTPLATNDNPVFDAVILSDNDDAYKMLERIVRLQITDLSKNEKMTKASALIENLQYADARCWEYEDPYTIVRSEGFQVACDVVRFLPNPFTFNFGQFINEGPSNVETMTKLKVDITFQGYLIVIAPPSETR